MGLPWIMARGLAGKRVDWYRAGMMPATFLTARPLRSPCPSEVGARAGRLPRGVTGDFQVGSVLDLHLGRIDRAGHSAVLVDLYFFRSLDVALELAVDDEIADLDLSLDVARIADDQHRIGIDLALEVPVDAEGALEGKVAVEEGVLGEKAGHLSLAQVVLALLVFVLHLFTPLIWPYILLSSPREK